MAVWRDEGPLVNLETPITNGRPLPSIGNHSSGTSMTQRQRSTKESVRTSGSPEPLEEFTVRTPASPT